MKISVHFENTSQQDMVRNLSEISGVPFALAPDARSEMSITVHMTDISLRSALEYLAEYLGLTFVVEGDTVLFTTHEDAYRRAVSSTLAELEVQE